MFVRKWGTQGTGNGQFGYQRGVTVAPDGNVYVSEGNVFSGDSRIQRFTSDGVFISKWGAEGEADGQFINPYGVAVASDASVYVADSANNRNQKFTSEGAFVSKWGTAGTGDGQFSWPTGVAVAPDGSVYVADRLNNRIQKFSVSP